MTLVPGVRRGRFRLASKPAANSGRAQASGDLRSRRTVERMVDEGTVELTDPARGSVDFGGDEHVAGDADIVWDDDCRGASSAARRQAQAAPLADRFSRPGCRRPARRRSGRNRGSEGGEAGARIPAGDGAVRHRRDTGRPRHSAGKAAHRRTQNDRLYRGPRGAAGRGGPDRRGERPGRAGLRREAELDRSPQRWLLMLCRWWLLRLSVCATGNTCGKNTP